MAGTTTLVAFDPTGQPAYSAIYGALSGSGRYIAFTASDNDLLVNDSEQVYVQDLVTGLTIRASVNASGDAANGSINNVSSTRGIALSVTGRYVAFQSSASNLVAGDTNLDYDIFVRDLQTGSINRVSLTTRGTQSITGFRGAINPSISANGRFIAFQSDAPDLVAGDRNAGGQGEDIFVRDVLTGRTILASVSSAGVQGLNNHINPALSANGRFVAFESVSGNLVFGDTNGTSDIFVRDLIANTTTRVSIASTGGQGFGQGREQLAGSFQPSISADGRFIAFSSSFTNLVLNDINEVEDVFVHDRLTQTTARVSLGTAGVEANGRSQNPIISANGRFVAFESDASNLVSGDTNNEPDVFVYDRLTGTTSLASVSDQSQQSTQTSGLNGISSDGRLILFNSFDLANLPLDPSESPNTQQFLYIRDTRPNTPLAPGNSILPNSPGSFISPGRLRVPSRNPIQGTNGNDRLVGTSAPDFFDARAGRDVVFGQAGDDILVGGPGGDALTGGAGSDQFVYNTLQDARDLIRDFTPGQDKIVLTTLLDRLTGGYNGQNAIADRLVRLIPQGTSTRVDVDINGPQSPAGFVPLVTVANVAIGQLNQPSNFVF